MIRRVKVTQISLILAISFIVVLPVYNHYRTLVEADLFPIDLSIENPDQEVVLIDREDNDGMFVSCVFPIALLPMATLLNYLSSSSFQDSSFDQIRSILRC